MVCFIQYQYLIGKEVRTHLLCGLYKKFIIIIIINVVFIIITIISLWFIYDLVGKSVGTFLLVVMLCGRSEVRISAVAL